MAAAAAAGLPKGRASIISQNSGESSKERSRVITRRF
jgi:hypothetical protein